MERNSIGCIVLVILLIGTNGFWVLNEQIQSDSRDYEKLTEQKEELETVYSELQDKYQALLLQISDLSSEYNSTESSYLELMDTFNELNVTYSDLISDHDLLESNYSALLDEYNDLSDSFDDMSDEAYYLDLVRIDSLVNDYYETIRDSITDSVTFEAKLSKHDQGELQWIGVDDDYYSITGSHRYSEAQQILLNILELAEVNVSEDNSSVCIEKILQFVNDKIDYQYDLDERIFAPTETLASGTGDCEDYSILVTALFELAGIDSAVAKFMNSDGDCHVMVLVHLSDLGGYDYYCYSDLTGYGLDSGQWIIIEPQLKITNQQLSSWFTQWNILAAAET